MSDIRIVLVDASHPGNIGACARAMKTMGLASLLLVRPRAHRDDAAFARAAGGRDLLEAARVLPSVGEAIGDCGLVLGATARARSEYHRVLEPREAASELATASGARPAAVLFGGERNGLANEEIARCQALIRIPTAGDYGSLNLAQAVQVVCYEILLARRRVDAPAAADRMPAIATAKEMSALFDHLGRVLRRTGFMQGRNAAQLEARLQRLFERALPDEGEVRILRGLLASVERGFGAAEKRD